MGTKGQQNLQAEVAGRKIDLRLDGSTVWIDGRERVFTSELLSATHLVLLVDGKSYSAVVVPQGDGGYRVTVAGSEFEVRLKDERDLLLERYGMAESSNTGIQAVRAPMPGLVLSIAVEPGQAVSDGMGLAVLEAMKMENELRAEREGVVKAVHVAPGDAVGKNDLLIEIE